MNSTRTTRRQCRFCKNRRPLNNLKSRLCAICEPIVREYNERKRQEREERSGAYEELCFERGEQCEICGMEPISRRLSVDHDHKTGKIRGLLCYKCNYGLFWFRDSPERMKDAAEYLERNG